ncbi:FixH family protein [Kaistella jeonii]|uniref:FixH protein n=1 Tax=Kaistella jeonii TaxID=266749 RepID=A0A0C1F859_9FLAO|nr:FixH family protein [Kaistella jeonii]KIA89352.1 FixH protein [Kaistella jeonii]SFC03517.1 FixH protein [Kaistella jeonii]VEI96673.1 FixH [Kaistella jeonii]
MFKKFNWGHGIALALGSFIAFILFMILIFPNGQQGAELVTDHYYSEELQYQDVINAKKNGDLLTEKPVYLQNTEGIKITFPASIILDQSKLNFELFRTNDANLDVKKEVTLDAQKSFFIPAKVISKGGYTLKLKWKSDKKPYQLDYDVQWK